jgi:hypothetical protein
MASVFSSLLLFGLLTISLTLGRAELNFCMLRRPLNFCQEASLFRIFVTFLPYISTDPDEDNVSERELSEGLAKGLLARIIQEGLLSSSAQGQGSTRDSILPPLPDSLALGTLNLSLSMGEIALG